MKINWLDRNLLQLPKFCLVFNEKEYLQALKDSKCNPLEAETWLAEGSAACVHSLYNKGSLYNCIVCIGEQNDVEGIDTASLLVHEAVHVFQRFAESIGEHNPSKEFEAYGIQKISYRLMEEYKRKIHGSK